MPSELVFEISVGLENFKNVVSKASRIISKVKTKTTGWENVGHVVGSIK